MHEYLTRLVSGYECAYGIHPNLLFLNSHHLADLEQELGDVMALQKLLDNLHMELVIDSYASHPHVSWSELKVCVAN